MRNAIPGPFLYGLIKPVDEAGFRLISNPVQSSSVNLFSTVIVFHYHSSVLVLPCSSINEVVVIFFPCFIFPI